MKSFKRRLISCLLVFAMVVTLVPIAMTTVFAADTSAVSNSGVLKDGKVVFNSIPPKDGDDWATMNLVMMEFYDKNYENGYTFDSFSDDFSKLYATYHSDQPDEQQITVDVTWNYDKEVLKTADIFTEKFPRGEVFWFNLTDLEFINYLLNRDPDSEEMFDTMANYSAELKACIENTNFELLVMPGAGMDDPFLTERIGTVKLVHDGIAYYTFDPLGATAQHVVYIPESTGNTKEEILAAIKARIDGYIKNSGIEITYSGLTVDEFVANTLAEYDAHKAELEAELATKTAEYDRLNALNDQNNTDIQNAQTAYDDACRAAEDAESAYNGKVDAKNGILTELESARQNGDDEATLNEIQGRLDAAQDEVNDAYQIREEKIEEENRALTTLQERQQYGRLLMEQLSPLMSDIDSLQREIDWVDEYKANFLESFEEGGADEFLNDAAGGFIYELKFPGSDEVFTFVAIKDNSKLTTPSYATKDINTQISVSSASSEVPLDAIIEVSEVTSGTEYDRIMKAIDAESGKSFDIKIHSRTTDEYVTKLADGTFEVRIPIPEEYNGKDLIVYYVDANGKVTPHTVRPEGNYAVFTTDHFSVYTLAPIAPEVANTADVNDSTLWIGVMLFSVCGFAGVAYLEYSDRMKKFSKNK